LRRKGKVNEGEGLKGEKEGKERHPCHIPSDLTEKKKKKTASPNEEERKKKRKKGEGRGLPNSKQYPLKI